LGEKKAAQKTNKKELGKTGGGTEELGGPKGPKRPRFDEVGRWGGVKGI